MAAYGQASDGGKDPQAASPTSRSCSRTTSGPGQVRPRGAADLRRAARATSCSPTRTRRSTAQKKGEDVDYVIAGRHDPDREPDRRRPRRPRARTPRRRSWTTCSPSPAQAEVRRAGATARSNEAVLAANADEVPEPVRPVHDRRARRLGEGQRRVLRPGERLGREDRGGARECRRRSEHVRRHRRAPCPRRPRRPARRRARAVGGAAGPAGARRRRRCGSASSCCCRWPRSSCSRSTTGSTAFWDAVTSRQAVAALRFTLHRGARRRGDQRGLRHAHRLGARPRRVPRQAHRQRADRPAVRAADDRRRASCCWRSTATRARSASTSPSRRPAVALALLFVTLPFVVRSVQPVLHRARPRDGGGRARRSAPRA